MRQLELENDILRAAAKVLKAESPSAMTNREKALVINELRAGDDPVAVSEKVVRRIMREEGLSVAYAKRRARHSSYKGEISDAPENLVNRHFRAAAPNELRLAGITEFGLPGGKVCLPPILDCFDGGLPAWSVGTSPKRGARQRQPRGRMRNAPRGAAPRDPFRSRVPLPLARLDRLMRGKRPDPVYVKRRGAARTARRWRGSSAGSRTSSSTIGTGRA